MLGFQRLAALSLEELIERRNLYLQEFWYGYAMYHLGYEYPTFHNYFTLARLDEVAKLCRIYEERIALFEE